MLLRLPQDFSHWLATDFMGDMQLELPRQPLKLKGQKSAETHGFTELKSLSVKISVILEVFK